MRELMIFDGITNIEDRYIFEAEDLKLIKPRPRVGIMLIAAVFATFAVFFAVSSMNSGTDSSPPLDSGPATEGASPDDSIDSAPNPSENDGALDDTDLNGADNIEDGIFIPPIEITPKGDGVVADMIGLIVYGGRVYTEAERIEMSESDINSFVGQHLGSATGEIDEWSGSDVYSKEFAATIVGEVYSMNGYISDFRIITVDAEGRSIATYENLNDITLEVGQDLYGEHRLNLIGINNISAMGFDSWYHGTEEQKPLEISSDTAEQFISDIMSAPFVAVELDRAAMSNENAAFLHIVTSNGTPLSLFVTEGGYLRYSHMYGDIYLDMSGSSAFDSILQEVFS